jgi:hypothetical protein
MEGMKKCKEDTIAFLESISKLELQGPLDHLAFIDDIHALNLQLSASFNQSKGHCITRLKPCKHRTL